MDKRSALKLKAGDFIIYGDHWQGQRVRNYRRGEVELVTRNGGIKLTSGEWVPYHYVFKQDEGDVSDTDDRYVTDWHDFKTQPRRYR